LKESSDGETLIAVGTICDGYRFYDKIRLCNILLLVGREAPLLLLLFNAGPVDVTFAQESPEVNAIIACGYPSQATGEALYRIVTATGPHSVPAGRLPATWPAQLNQVIDLGCLLLLLSVLDS